MVRGGARVVGSRCRLLFASLACWWRRKIDGEGEVDGCRGIVRC